MTNAGPAASVAADARDEMAAYDAMPAPGRRALREAWFEWSATVCAGRYAAMRNSTRFRHFIQQQDRLHAKEVPACAL